MNVDVKGLSDVAGLRNFFELYQEVAAEWHMYDTSQAWRATPAGIWPWHGDFPDR